MGNQWKRGDYLVEKNLNRKTQLMIDQSITGKFGGGPSNARTRIMAYNNTGSAIPPGGLASVSITDGTIYADADPVVKLEALTADNLSRVIVVDRQLLAGESGTVTQQGMVIAPVHINTAGDEYATFSNNDTLFESSTTPTRHKIMFVGEEYDTDTNICVVDFNGEEQSASFSFRQANASFLNAGTYWNGAYANYSNYEFVEATIHGQGTFSVQLYNGTLQGPVITQATTNPIDLTSVSDWIIGSRLDLLVSVSTNVDLFDLEIILVPK